LSIAALAEAGAALDRDDLVNAARQAADFVLTTMRDADGRLLHAYRAGVAQIAGFLEDYAYLADGLLALWEATFERRYLDEAVALAERATELFADDAGGFFTTASDAEQLIVRQKEIVESATPAPGATLSLVLQRLALMLDRPELAKTAVHALRIAHLYVQRAPQAVATWLCSLDFYVSKPKEIAFTGPLDPSLLGVVNERYLPNRVMAASADGSQDAIALLRDKPQTDQAVAYVCERFVCQAPTSDPAELARQLG
jgi:hypothetical protein